MAVSLDLGILQAEQRHAQAAADAAAIAGAIDLYKNYVTNNGADTKGTAYTSALDTAAANGYANDGVTTIVTVTIPPTSGYFVNQAGYVEVIAQYNQSRGFSNRFGSGPSRSRPGLWRGASGPTGLPASSPLIRPRRAPSRGPEAEL